jgi:hypothetical protein
MKRALFLFATFTLAACGAEAPGPETASRAEAIVAPGVPSGCAGVHATGVASVEDLPDALRVLVRMNGVPVCVDTPDGAIAAGLLSPQHLGLSRIDAPQSSDPMPADGTSQPPNPPSGTPPGAGSTPPPSTNGNSPPSGSNTGMGSSDPMPADGK